MVHCSILLGFLELINNMLTSGMVPALFPDEEKESIIGQVCRCTSFVFCFVCVRQLVYYRYVNSSFVLEIHGLTFSSMDKSFSMLQATVISEQLELGQSMHSYRCVMRLPRLASLPQGKVCGHTLSKSVPTTSTLYSA